MSALCDPSGPPGPPPSPAPPPLSAQELWQEVRAFLSGADPVRGQQLSAREHARCALLLLRCLPPARHAALDHLRAVFDEAVAAHLAQLDGAGAGAGGEPAGLAEVLQEAQATLAEFVRANPRAWAPAVSAWAIELLGQLSSKYAGQQQRVPHAAGLNELLQLWMACRATRALLDIYTQCLAAMIGLCPDACVDALLDASGRHSPHFDWVVAHIGSAFPSTIISRVLSCGLKDFCAHGGAPPGDATAPDKRVPKIASVVGILGHLASRHAASIRHELLRLFHESLGPGRDPTQAAAVPFLLQLAAMSPLLLATVSGELVEALKPSVLNQLQQHLAGRPREELENMLNMAVHLVCQTSAGAYRLLQFLLDTAMPASVITPPGLAVHDGVREACDRLVQLLLLHLQKLVHGRGGAGPGDPVRPPPPRPVPFLEELRGHVRELCVETLRLERKRHLWLHQLLGLLALYGGPSCGPEAMCHLLTLARGQEELALAAQLHAVLSACVADLLPATAHRCVLQIHAGALPEPHAAQLLRNLALLAQWEAEGPAGLGAQLGAALAQHLHDLGQLLLHCSPEVAEAAALLLSVCPLPRALRPAHLFVTVRSAALQFFLALRRRSPAGLGYSERLLARLSAVSPAAMKAVLQLLVEGALHRGNAELFGGRPEPTGDEVEGVRLSLLDGNRRFTTAVTFGGGVWSVFHAGVIGHGLKPPLAPPQQEPEEAAHNAQRFLSLLLRCCRGGRYAPADAARPAAINPEAAKAVAAALVEAVCPDAAGGELGWPPEEQARGTVERDLRIGRCFREHPLLFPLLRLVAAGPPALCYCSVLLRGLAATLVAHWEACRDPDTASSPWHLQASCALVSCLAEGSLLPPVLGNMQELFPELAPFEVRLLLLVAWGYLRDHGPLPQKFVFQPERGVFARDFTRDGDAGRYLAVLHSVLHKNIDRLGLLSGRFNT